MHFVGAAQNLSRVKTREAFIISISSREFLFITQDVIKILRSWEYEEIPVSLRHFQSHIEAKMTSLLADVVKNSDLKLMLQ